MTEIFDRKDSDGMFDSDDIFDSTSFDSEAHIIEEEFGINFDEFT